MKKPKNSPGARKRARAAYKPLDLTDTYWAKYGEQTPPKPVQAAKNLETEPPAPGYSHFILYTCRDPKADLIHLRLTRVYTCLEIELTTAFSQSTMPISWIRMLELWQSLGKQIRITQYEESYETQNETLYHFSKRIIEMQQLFPRFWAVMMGNKQI